MESFDTAIQEQSTHYASGLLKTPEFDEARKDIVKSNIIANAAAHGYFMGYKWAMKKYARSFLSKLGIQPKPPLAEHALRKESESAAKYYLTRRFKGASSDHKMLLKIMVARGFRNGVRTREAEITNGSEAATNRASDGTNPQSPGFSETANG